MACSRYAMLFSVSPFASILLPFFFNDTATTEIYTLSLHDALPISLAMGKARVRQHDHTGALQPEQGFRDLEVRASQLRCDAAHVALAVDHRQHLPLGRQEIELTFTRLLGRREHGHDAEVGDAPLDAGPFVDAARTLHQQRLGGDAHHGVRGQLGRGALAEREVALAPAHDLEHDLFDLEAHLALELARGERAERHEDLA